MSTIATPLPETTAAWTLPYRGKVGMACLIFAESAIFTILLWRIFFTWERVLSDDSTGKCSKTPILLHSLSAFQHLTIHFAGKSSERRPARAVSAAVAAHHCLGRILSLRPPAEEWHRLIYEHGLTIRRIFLGQRNYSLVESARLSTLRLD